MNQADLEKFKSKLPVFPGILRKEDYFNSAVLIPLVKINNDYNFLFEKRAANIRQGGEVCFPGGEFDPEIDSTYRDTAIRECIEELGIKREKISIYGNLDTLIGPIGVTVDSFPCNLDIQDISELNFDKSEVEKIFIIPVSFFIENAPEQYHVRLEINPTDIDKNGLKIDTLPAKELQLPDKYSRIWRGKKHRVLVYKTSHGVIWGITAELIYEVINKLKNASSK